jgi:hypothetical protein
VSSPVGLAGEGCVVEAVEGVGAAAVNEGGVAEEGNVVDWWFWLVDVVWERKRNRGITYI